MARQKAATEFPLHLCEVLEEELEALLPDAVGEVGAPEASSPWEFTPAQIRREMLPGLLARLHDPGDEVCRWLRKRLSSAFCALLEQQGKVGGPSVEALRGSLADELNRLLRDEDDHPVAEELARACRVEHIRLSEEMEMLLADPPADRKRLLRLLLEEIFPAELEACCERRLRRVRQRVHTHPHGLAALCLSGGGIRSAVFGLGVIQGLARRNLLHGFDYLSTVSGGGYLGSLLSAWIHRHPRGLDGVSSELGGRPPRARMLQPEPAQLNHVRNFSNYLSPKLGILSADSWTLISIFVRNLFAYWLVLVPLLLAVLALPRLYVSICMGKIEPLLDLGTPIWSTRSVYLFPDGLFVLGSLLMTVAIGYIGWCRPSGGRRSTPRGFLLACLLPLVASAVLFTVYWAWYRALAGDPRDPPGWKWFVVPTVLINLFGWSVHAVPALARGRVKPLVKLRELPLLVVAGTGGGLLAMLATQVFPDPTKVVDAVRSWTAYTAPWYGVFAIPCVLGSFVLGETLFAGLSSRWTDDEDREWWSRSAAWLLIVMAAWVAVAGVVLFGPVLLAFWKGILTPVGALAGLATALLARSSLTSESCGVRDKAGSINTIVDTALAFVAPVFVVILTAALSLGVSWLLYLAPLHDLTESHEPRAAVAEDVAFWHMSLVAEMPAYVVAVFLVLALGTGLLMALLIDINKFSLHAMYRNRLIRTFLGASRENRRPNPFTGFDGEDDLEMWRLRYLLFLRPENLAAHGAGLCRHLKEGTRPLLSAIFSRHLADETRRLLEAYTCSAEPSQELLQALTEDFNRLIRGRFDDQLLRGLSVTEEEREQLRQASSEDVRYSLQRDFLRRAFQEEEIDTARPPKPLHVINVALNLVGGKDLAWQQRKAESFTFSPLHCGSARVGYRAAHVYAGGEGRRRATQRRSAGGEEAPAREDGREDGRAKSISLGTAMAISGAAASPNMGYHSSPAITFLMTFFNARLGWWLGNPGVAGARTFGHAQPHLADGPLISEVLGLTNNRNPYVYLSDGGHFENLGLYEMVLRRCRHILVVDAGQDPDCRFEDLGNALRKIRIDLGIRIQLTKVPIWAEVPAEEKGRYCAVGKILYSEVDDTEVDGLLLYIKPAVYGCGEPQDVLHYKKLNKLFPHESTGDQWFSEQQFESYRALGLHAMDAICKEAGEEEIAGLPGLFQAARRHLGEEAAETAAEDTAAGPREVPAVGEAGDPPASARSVEAA